MTGALVILIAMVAVGLVLYITDIIFYRRKGRHAQSLSEVAGKEEEGERKEQGEGSREEGEVCCGMHVVCEKTNLSPVTGEIVYYDDEELDRFRGREADAYTPEEIEEFRDVLLTLLPEDVAGWSRSIQVREITLPTEVREELLLIVSELRGSEAAG